jgi:arylsulfatase
MFQERGYATAGMGKWHLGTRLKFHPTRHGFKEWLGIPYSNDNSKYHPSLASQMPPLPFYEGERVVENDPDQALFTKRFTEHAIRFIELHASQPFFLYMPHVMPHVPIFASKDFKGRSKAGLYGDVLEELDWSVGQIMVTLKRLDIERNTLVIFISDNGPFLSYGDHAGSATPFREGKLTTFEGGVRVPCIARWPERIPAGRICSDPWMSISILPTMAELIGGKLSSLKIDGKSARGLLLGEENAGSPQEALFFYSGTALQAVRSGRWKLHFPHPYITVAAEPGKNGRPSNWGKLAPSGITQSGVEGIATRHGYRVEQIEESLFDLETDPAEENNVAAAHPDIVKRLTGLANAVREEIGDSQLQVTGRGLRDPGLDVSVDD